MVHTFNDSFKALPLILWLWDAHWLPWQCQPNGTARELWGFGGEAHLSLHIYALIFAIIKYLIRKKKYYPSLLLKYRFLFYLSIELSLCSPVSYKRSCREHTVRRLIFSVNVIVICSHIFVRIDIWAASGLLSDKISHVTCQHPVSLQTPHQVCILNY